MGLRVAIVGGGWAGMACAVDATRRGHAVTVYEAARHWGGRARAVEASLPGGQTTLLDNGQHILIGAYAQTLALMAQVGVDVEASLLRLPLRLRFPDGSGLALPALAPWIDRATRRLVPLDVLAGVLGASGWSWQDKRSLLATSGRWQRMQFRCAAETTVADLCAGLTQRVRDELTEPLCLSALNTLPAEASGQVFLRVLEDALFKTPGGSQLLLPQVDLGALFPVAAARWLERQDARCMPGRRVQAIRREAGGWQVDAGIEEAPFDRLVLACASWDAARLAADAAPAWSAGAEALRHEAIATVYLQGDAALAAAHPAAPSAALPALLPAPLLALRSGPDAPAQFVLDRGRCGGPPGLLAFVVSVSVGERDELQQQVLAQARAQLGLEGLRPVLTVVERRATFSCAPALSRPPMRVADGLLACGDYVDGPYPSTLEGAVRNGLAAAAAL